MPKKSSVGRDIRRELKAAHRALKRRDAELERLRRSLERSKRSGAARKRLETEERVRAIVHAAPFGVHMYELDGRGRLLFSGANPAADQILGIDHRQLMGKPIEQAFPGLRETPVPGRYARIARGDGKYEEEQLGYDDGRIRGTFQVIAFGTGKRRMTVFFQDISVRKKAEAENTLLAQTLKSVQDCISITDLRDRIIFVNEAFLATYGYTEGDVLGKDVSILRSPRMEDAQTREILAATLEGGWHGELWNRRKDGTDFPVEVWTSPVRDHQGSVIAAVGVARDITERKRAEALLEERDLWLRDSQRAGRIGSYNLNIPSDSWTSSEILNEIFGISPDAVKTVNSWNALVHPDERDEMRRYFFEEVVGAKHPFNKEYRIVRANDGEIRWVWGKGELTYDASGRPVQMFGTIQDITERAVAEEQIRSSLREKEMLLKEIHHRVKNNMQVVTSLLNLEAEKAGDQRTRALFRESMTRIRSMALVHEKLYRSPSLANIEFGEYLRSVSGELLRTSRSTGVLCTVDADPLQLGIDTAIPCGLIASELVSNALKHAFAGREGGNVKIRLRRHDPSVVAMSVEDDGVGLPANIDHLHPGSMGLNLVVSLSTQIGGAVSVERNGGTRFTVTFPA